MTKIAAARKPEPVAEAPASDRIVTARDNRPDPAEDAIVAFKDAIDQRDGFRDRITELVEASGRAVAHDEDTVARCGDLVKQIGAASRVIEAERKTVKEPFLSAGRAIDQEAKALAGPLDDADRTVREKMRTYAREEQAKREAEERRQREAAAEAERKRQEEIAKAEADNKPVPEAVAPAPPPPPPPPAPIRGDYGSTTSVTTKKVGKDIDYDKAYLAVRNNTKVQEAIDKAISAMVRAGVHEIEGVEVTDDIGLAIR